MFNQSISCQLNHLEFNRATRRWTWTRTHLSFPAFRAEGALTKEREMPTTAKSVVITRRIYKWHGLFAGLWHATHISDHKFLWRAFTDGHQERKSSFSWASQFWKCSIHTQLWADRQPFDSIFSFRGILGNSFSVSLRVFLMGLWCS